MQEVYAQAYTNASANRGGTVVRGPLERRGEFLYVRRGSHERKRPNYSKDIKARTMKTAARSTSAGGYAWGDNMAPTADTVRLLLDRRTGVLPVLKDEKVVGIITR